MRTSPSLRRNDLWACQYSLSNLISIWIWFLKWNPKYFSSDERSWWKGVRHGHHSWKIEDIAIRLWMTSSDTIVLCNENCITDLLCTFSEDIPSYMTSTVWSIFLIWKFLINYNALPLFCNQAFREARLDDKLHWTFCPCSREAKAKCWLTESLICVLFQKMPSTIVLQIKIVRLVFCSRWLD